MLYSDSPALILAPMEGVTDAPMRALMGEMGAFSFAVSEFLRVSIEVPPRRVFHRHIPELGTGGRTLNGLPVQVQLLGGDADRMARSAVVACEAGARAIDINFGCPAPTVNRHDGGASLLKHPLRIREIVAAMRAATPKDIPVSAKLRLGWDSIDAIHENACMAAEGGANWITIHARTRVQGYHPPVFWKPIGQVRARLEIPVVANGDIWTIEDFRRCREETGCRHFMLGRSALTNPPLPLQVARELGLTPGPRDDEASPCFEWLPLLQKFVQYMRYFDQATPNRIVRRVKQWLNMARLHGDFGRFDLIKRAQTVEEIFAILADTTTSAP